MPIPNVFTSDLFGLTSLTATINAIPFQPTGIQQLGIYESAGISTLDCFIEQANGTLSLFTVKPRGAPGQPLATEQRTGYSFRIPHIPAQDAILADEVIGVRAFGSESEMQTVEMKRNESLTRMRMYMDYTLEYHRMTNILGSFIDSNGTSTSLFTTFGLVEQYFDADLDDTDQNIIGDCDTYLSAIETGLGGVSFTGAVALCGSTFWSALRGHAEVAKYWINTQYSPEFRADPRQPLEFGGITWMRYRGTSTVKIPDAEARIIPLGVPGMFITRFAPANYIESVGTTGLPFYAKSEPMDMGKGVNLEAQCNPLNLVIWPRAIIKLTT